MNKKLLAIAVGAVIALPGATLANPKVYGKVNVTLDSMETEFAADTFPGAGADNWQLNSNASRLGVKGEYDLEVGGLKALYQAEYEINVDNGARSNAANDAVPFSQRNIFAGLKGDFGTLRAGKFDTPVKTAEGKVDQFNDLAGDMDSFVAGQARADNIVQYTSPKLADSLTINIATILAEGADVNADGEVEEGLFDSPQVSLVFEQGGLYAALAFAQNAAADTQTADGFTRADIMRLVAQYKIDALEIGGLFQRASDVADGSDLEDTSMLISAGFSIDRIKLKAQYGMTKGDQSDEELTMMGLGADYKLAKSSKAFVYMTKLEKDSTGEENSVFGLGLEHNF